jgi:hypothetical protein
MNRRDFVLTGGAGMAFSSAAAGADAKRSVIELTLFKMRNTVDGMTRRTNDFLGKAALPALKRNGAGPVGVFQAVIAPDSPFALLLTSYPNFAAYETTIDKLAADEEFVKASDALYAEGLPYTRVERTLLRGFPSFPGIEVAKADGGKTRVYELRQYESNNVASLRRKVKMFDEGEIDLFRKVGMVPVFFGTTVAGRNMPNLVYMVGFDDMAARDKAWGAFGSSPEWKKMSSQPGVSDGEVVSNITNWILRPAPFSEIR